ncbi:MAG: S46 family peptidase [Candidatus Riflebacteria bacterium]|nr:S46 family peptidase [Candidatus Riflebacteria bacterium]
MIRRVLSPVVLVVCSWLLAAPGLADEGFWLFNEPPLQLFKQACGFEPTPAWLDRLQRATVRFSGGQSGAFVSPDGLVATVHDVAARALESGSGGGPDLTTDGFVARSPPEEIRLAGLQLEALTSIEDVTGRVVAPAGSPAGKGAGQGDPRAAISALERAASDGSGAVGCVVSLNGGTRHHLYRSRRFDDVRLVFAPERQVARFGGHSEQFEYPRSRLDVSLFRVYQGGKPYRPPEWLRLARSGPERHDPLVVAGHPGATVRLETAAVLEFWRDRFYPLSLRGLHRLTSVLVTCGETSPGAAARVRDELAQVRARCQRQEGALAALLDPILMVRRRASEQQLRDRIGADPALAALGPAWDRMAAARRHHGELLEEHWLVMASGAFGSTLVDRGRTIVRAATQAPGSWRSALDRWRTSEGRMAEGPEELRLAHWFTFGCELLGADHGLVRELLAGKSPRQRASELVVRSALRDAQACGKLLEGGEKAVAASVDPAIVLARQIEAAARDLSSRFEARVKTAERQAQTDISRARVATGQWGPYPPGTSTLRFSFGVARGYRDGEAHVQLIVPLSRLFERSAEWKMSPIFGLPDRWIRRRAIVDAAVPLHFSTNADATVEQAGGPVVDRNGEWLGVHSGVNRQALGNDLMYTDTQARTVAVHGQAIVEVLRKIHEAGPLADELAGLPAAAPGRR